MEFIRKKNRGEGLSVEQKGQALYLTFPSFTRTQAVEHLFSTRLGGVSEGIFSTMNLSYTRGDKKEAVDENYRRIADILGCKPEAFVCSDQTHTTNIRKVTEADCGKGVLVPKDYRDVDGLVTDREGIVLVTFFADCVPLYFLDAKRRVIGLAHSGWRGTVGRIGKNMIDTMVSDYGCKKEHILAAIGPSICADCYEVSEDVAGQFEAEFGSAVLQKGKRPGKYQLDLWKANEEVLLQAGLTVEQIEVTDICTCCNASLLFSHRASEGKRGNLGAFLMLKRENREGNEC
ncbi:MAG: peptidoglycan editing factor PgeF [Lachnospiraceae bacterium]|nr:peptidoglycan editing factor PgeF [Lachnospiraceae bacterium]MBD5538158.1 peptidoglycan editing factor PgeF [Lachnospiraceae bacterium]